MDHELIHNLLQLRLYYMRFSSVSPLMNHKNFFGNGEQTDLSYPSYRDGHAVASVDFIALHIQSQSVQGNP